MQDVQPARETGDRTGDRERHQFDARDVERGRHRGRLVVADSDERTAGA
jgi:hypothetical protein